MTSVTTHDATKPRRTQTNTPSVDTTNGAKPYLLKRGNLQEESS